MIILSKSSSYLNSDRHQRISSILEETSPSLNKSYIESSNDIIHSIHDIKITLESNLSLNNIILSYSKCILDKNKINPELCNIDQDLKYVQNIISEHFYDIHQYHQHLHWDIQNSKLYHGLHITYPDLMIYILLSTISNIILIWEYIHITISFIDNNGLSSLLPFKKVYQNDSPGLLRIEIQVKQYRGYHHTNTSNHDNVSLNNKHNLIILIYRHEYKARTAVETKRFGRTKQQAKQSKKMGF